MCLITNKKPKIAEEDIVCYKIVHKDLKSEIQKFQYEFDTLYSTEIKTTLDIDKIRPYSSVDSKYLDDHYADYIDECFSGKLTAYSEGFHSSSKVDILQNRSSSIVLVECIIPKGSQYVEDFVGYIVSNQIIIKKVLNN